jgi:hypothetical protein
MTIARPTIDSFLPTPYGVFEGVAAIRPPHCVWLVTVNATKLVGGISTVELASYTEVPADRDCRTQLVGLPK